MRPSWDVWNRANDGRARAFLRADDTISLGPSRTIDRLRQGAASTSVRDWAFSVVNRPETTLISNESRSQRIKKTGPSLESERPAQLPCRGCRLHRATHPDIAAALPLLTRGACSTHRSTVDKVVVQAYTSPINGKATMRQWPVAP
jgi:hypothetical protein